MVPAVQVAELGSGNNIEVELPGIDEWEQVEERKIESSELPQTERAALIKSRLGQGRFKTNVSRFETRCRVTQVSNPGHLIASHIKPWRESNNEERLAVIASISWTESRVVHEAARSPRPAFTRKGSRGREGAL